MKLILGPLLLLIAAVLYGVLTPLLKTANQKIPPFTVMAISMFSLFVFSFVASLIFERNFNFLSTKSSILTLGLIGFINFVGFWLFILAFKHTAVWQQQIIFSVLTPIFAGIFAFLILKEPLSYKLFLGLAIATFGLYIALK